MGGPQTIVAFLSWEQRTERAGGTAGPMLHFLSVRLSTEGGGEKEAEATSVFGSEWDEEIFGTKDILNH